VLVDGGIVLLSFHIGDERVHRDEFLDQAVDLDFYFLQPQWMQERVREAGFDVEARIDRAPYTPLEYPSRRGYILARRSREEPA
jgi:hypothetical protein